MNVRSALVTTHLWIGLIAAPVLLVLGVTGALLVVEAPIADRIDARTSLVTPGAKELPVADLFASVRRTYADARLLGVQLADSRAHSVALTVSTGPKGFETLLLDPYTAKVLGSQGEQQTFFRRVRQLHRQLLVGRGGNVVVLCVAVALVLLAVSGPAVWWPRRRVGVRWARGGWRRILDLHAVLGALSCVFLLLFALTGLVVHWDDAVQNAIGMVTGVKSPRVPQNLRGSGCATSAMLGPDELLAAGARTFPGARAMYLQMPDEDAATVRVAFRSGAMARVAFRYPEDRTPNGRSIALIDACTGLASFEIDTRSAPLSYWYPRSLNRALHTGDVFGWPSQVLAFVFSLCLAAMAVTGPAVWVMRLRGRSASVASATRGAGERNGSSRPSGQRVPKPAEAFAETAAEET